MTLVDRELICLIIVFKFQICGLFFFFFLYLNLSMLLILLWSHTLPILLKTGIPMTASVYFKEYKKIDTNFVLIEIIF